MGRHHPFRQALWLGWFGLALIGFMLVYDLVIGLWLGVWAMLVLICLGLWLLRDIRRRRLELEAWRRERHG